MEPSLPNMEPSSCSICLELIDTAKSSTLNCKHTFHLTCIEKWNKVANTCPYCRYYYTNDTVNVYTIEPGANLSGADLSEEDLTGANLTGANLNGAFLANQNLTGANLIGANLTEANLSRANLTYANLTQAN